MHHFAQCALLTAAVILVGAPPPAATIAARHVAAIGGEDAVKALTSLSFKGVYHEGGYTFAASQTFMRPYYEVVDPHLQPVIMEGFDGRPWEYYGEFGVVLRTAGAPALATSHASEFDDALVDYQRKGSRIALAGLTLIEARAAYDILITLADGFAKHLYVDAATYMIVGSRQTAKVHAFGDRVTSQSLIGGYRRVAGVLIATTYREVDVRTGRELNRMTWTSVVANRALSVSLFSPPRFERSPLSRLLEDLYLHRGDAGYDVGTYRSYRRGAPATATEVGLEFIAYQMLKTGANASALALLQMNARDRPRSADAQFGLGRAYRAAGDQSRARAAFRTALHLRPGDRRAAQALSQTP